VFGQIFPGDKNDEALAAEIDSMRWTGRGADAAALTSQALTQFPNSPYILTQKGWEEFNQRHYAEAIEAFTQALATKPVEGALQGKVAALRLTRRFQEAADLFDQASDEFPRSPGILNERGWLLLDQKHYAEAAKAFDASLNVDNRDEGA